MITYIKDNEPEGPERTVISVRPATRPNGIPELDGEPFTQLVTLNCNHMCYNTYGNQFEEKVLGQIMRCYVCGKKNYENSTKD